MIEVVRSHYLVLDALVEVLQTVLGIVALEYKQVFHLELVIL